MTPPADLPEWRRERLAAVRLYLVTDETTPLQDLPDLVRLVTAAGVDAVQLRRKEVPWRDLVAVAAACRSAAHRAGALFIVNDHPELALAVDADGLHVGQEDASVTTVRTAIGRGRLVGVSTHDLGQALAATAGGADYLGIGPIHVTPTKPGRPACGIGLVPQVRAAVALPLVAIGGIDSGNAEQAMAAGADAVAVVRAICRADDPAAAARGLRAAVDRVAASRGRSTPVRA
ncbi:MAG TPA: thiamine phosphate synthase [Candidatus Micrarchaeia archaeon]|nr:thiamine phosphate synthase [Candidatus Micrarchaeia archaeon]